MSYIVLRMTRGVIISISIVSFAVLVVLVLVLEVAVAVAVAVAVVLALVLVLVLPGVRTPMGKPSSSSGGGNKFRSNVSQLNSIPTVRSSASQKYHIMK